MCSFAREVNFSSVQSEKLVGLAQALLQQTAGVTLVACTCECTEALMALVSQKLVNAEGHDAEDVQRILRQQVLSQGVCSHSMQLWHMLLHSLGMLVFEHGMLSAVRLCRRATCFCRSKSQKLLISLPRGL